MTPSSAPTMSTNDDTEITLGTGKMLAMFFGLVILCAVFFGMGFSMGKNSVKAGPELLPSPGTTSGTRPSASAGKAVVNSTPAPDSKSSASPQASEANPPAQGGSTSDQPPPHPPAAGEVYSV